MAKKSFPPKPAPMTVAQGKKLWRGSPADRKQDVATGIDTPSDHKADAKAVKKVVGKVNKMLGNH